MITGENVDQKHIIVSIENSSVGINCVKNGSLATFIQKAKYFVLHKRSKNLYHTEILYYIRYSWWTTRLLWSWVLSNLTNFFESELLKKAKWSR